MSEIKLYKLLSLLKIWQKHTLKQFWWCWTSSWVNKCKVLLVITKQNKHTNGLKWFVYTGCVFALFNGQDVKAGYIKNTTKLHLNIRRCSLTGNKCSLPCYCFYIYTVHFHKLKCNRFFFFFFANNRSYLLVKVSKMKTEKKKKTQTVLYITPSDIMLTARILCDTS